MSEFKGTPGPWVADIRGGCAAIYPERLASDTNGCHRGDSRNIAYSDKGAHFNGRHWEIDPAVAHDFMVMAAAPELLKALQWALPLAIIAIEAHRMERVKCGHMDINGTYMNGEKWVGIYQDEVDRIESCRLAIAKALREPQ